MNIFFRFRRQSLTRTAGCCHAAEPVVLLPRCISGLSGWRASRFRRTDRDLTAAADHQPPAGHRGDDHTRRCLLRCRSGYLTRLAGAHQPPRPVLGADRELLYQQCLSGNPLSTAVPGHRSFHLHRRLNRQQQRVRRLRAAGRWRDRVSDAAASLRSRAGAARADPRADVRGELPAHLVAVARRLQRLHRLTDHRCSVGSVEFPGAVDGLGLPAPPIT